MFASASASLASRVPVRLGERRGRSAAKVNTSARAATTYTLDGKGCAGARTGDTGEFKNNIVAYKKRDAPACPIKPIAVTELCASHEGGKFKMLDAIFEQVGDDLYIYGCKPDECVRDASLPRTARASSRQDDIDMAFPSAVSRGRINRPLPRAGLGLAETVFFAVLFSSPLSRPSRPASPRVPRPAAVAHPPPLRFAALPRPARRAAARTPPSTSRWTAAPSRPRRGRNCASSPGSSSASAGSASRYSATSSRTREARKNGRASERRERARKDARGRTREGSRERVEANERYPRKPLCFVCPV